MNEKSETSPACCPEGSKKAKPWYWNKAFLVAYVLSFLVAASYFWTGLVAFRVNVLGYFRQIGWAILLGLFLGGLLERYVPREYISALLARKRKRTILNSVLLGFVMSACSHGIIALAIELHKKGASTPVVVSFLLASPWANLPITLMLLGFFGLKALYIILGALAVAFITGVLYQFLEGRGLVEANTRTLAVEGGYSVLDDVKRRLRGYRFSVGKLGEDARRIWDGTVALADMVLWWILIGIGLSGLAAAFVPQDFFRHYMGPTALGLFATLGLATVMEVCSEGTSPLAFEIYRQTGAFGNAFVFLTAGVVTDFTEIGLLWANVGKKTALWLPAVAVPQVVLLGFFANHLFR